jgi:hypothetical protein
MGYKYREVQGNNQEHIIIIAKTNLRKRKLAMKFVITIDDAEAETLKLLLMENVGIPIVIGVPVGLIGRQWENKIIATLDLIKTAIKELDVEIASHGYYHIVPGDSDSKVNYFLKFIRGLSSHPDKSDYIFRLFNFAKRARVMTHVYVPEVEIIQSQKELENLCNLPIITFLYPGGYVTKELLDIVQEKYLFARTTNISINLLSNLRKTPDRFLLKTISVSRYTNFSKLEKYYLKLKKMENQTEEIIVIETYHILTHHKPKTLYEIPFKIFNSHCRFLKSSGAICRFIDLKAVNNFLEGKNKQKP